MFSVLKFCFNKFVSARVIWSLLLGPVVIWLALQSAGYIPVLIAMVLFMPIWCLYAVFSVYGEVKHFKTELIDIAAKLTLNSINDAQSRDSLIQSVCNAVGCDSKNPLIVSYFVESTLKAKGVFSGKIAS